ncbi:PRD domain-containing protein [Cellulomonas sp. NPDC089187]|uniref:PRD domain-containing protein n=1 Tax=Cellulomonas sp. NPDC089187 TaxID=3154970 RepID=UPI003440BC3B
MTLVRVTKVFNNNAVLGVDPVIGERVLLGTGIGFGVKPGDPVDPAKIGKTFVPTRGTPAERIARLLTDLPPEDLDLTGEVLADVQDVLGAQAAEQVLLPLADHLSFALRRMREGAPPIEYPLQWEVPTLYPAEVALARRALGVIERRRGVRLPDEEAVPVALHFVNAQLGTADMSQTVGLTRLLSEAVGVIDADLGTRIDPRSADAARFVTHLRYLIADLRADRGVREPADDQMAAALRAARPREWACAERIAALVGARVGREVGGGEVAFLALHVDRLAAR